MKIGFIFECPRGGPDQQVIEYLATQIAPNVEIVNRFTNTNKPQLIQQCGIQASALLQQGCERVIIVWDLMPRWGDATKRPLCVNDVATVHSALKKARMDDERIRLLCISAMLEALLIADERALNKLLSRPTRAAKCARKKNPDRLPDPKGELMDFYKEHGREYASLTDALKIVQALGDFNRLNKISSFQRLSQLVGEPDFICATYRVFLPRFAHAFSCADFSTPPRVRQCAICVANSLHYARVVPETRAHRADASGESLGHHNRTNSS